MKIGWTERGLQDWCWYQGAIDPLDQEFYGWYLLWFEGWEGWEWSCGEVYYDDAAGPKGTNPYAIPSHWTIV